MADREKQISQLVIWSYLYAPQVMEPVAVSPQNRPA